MNVDYDRLLDDVANILPVKMRYRLDNMFWKVYNINKD